MKYARLSKAAKERAREWWKETEAECWGQDRAPDYYEDMAMCLKFLGIEVHCERSMQNNTGNGVKHEWVRTEYGFEWSGFWSQGDGLVFQGAWDAADVDMTGLAGYAPQDETLKRIATAMTALMLKWPEAHAKITTVSYRPGLPGMLIEEAYTGVDESGMNDDPEMPAEDVKRLKAQVFAAAHWCYRTLEDSYEYDTSDEVAVGGIEANDYDFDREGIRTTLSRRPRQRVAATNCPTT